MEVTIRTVSYQSDTFSTSVLIIAALSRDFVENAVQLLITRFMPLNPTDLQQWLADPEEWLHVEDKENDQWEFEIRVSAIDQSHIHFINVFLLAL